MRISDWSSDVCSSDLDLAMQASTGTLSDDDRALVQKEVAALTSQIGAVATRTTFNGTSLLNGTTALDGAGAGTAVHRKRVGQGQRVSVRVVIGGRRAH